MERRIITTEVTAEDEHMGTTLRFQCLRDYVGQEKIKSTLNIYIEAAKTRGEPLDHVPFYDPPGLGKTTLAGIIANKMGTNMKVASGPAIEKPGKMTTILDSLREGDVLSVDGVYHLNRQVEEVLYPAMEDFAIGIMPGKDSTARSIHPDPPHFILVGATARAGLLIASLRDRFGVIQRLGLYTPEELKIIILHSARVLGVGIKAGEAMGLVRHSRRTPRLVNRPLKRARDFIQIKYDSVIIQGMTDFTLDAVDVDKLGPNQNDRDILLMVIEKFSNGPARLDTLAATLGEDSGTLEEVYEPYPLTDGPISHTPKDRIATEAACRHLELGIQKPPC